MLPILLIHFPFQFRHRVKFEGMDIPPSRSSQESRLSTLSSTLPSPLSSSLSSSFSSPRPLSSAVSMRSEDLSEPGFDVQPYLVRLLPCVSELLSRFDQVNQITEDVHSLEMKLEEAQARRRNRLINNDAARSGESAKPKELEGKGRETGEVRHRKTGLLYPKPRVSLPSSFSFTPSTLNYSAASIVPHSRRTCSESESVPFQLQPSRNNLTSEAAKLASGTYGLYPAGSTGVDRFPRRRAWHSGSSHSADAAQRILLSQGGAPCGGEHFEFNTRPRSEEGTRRQIGEGLPVKRKAWISEGSETEQDWPGAYTGS